MKTIISFLFVAVFAASLGMPTTAFAERTGPTDGPGLRDALPTELRDNHDKKIKDMPKSEVKSSSSHGSNERSAAKSPKK